MVKPGTLPLCSTVNKFMNLIQTSPMALQMSFSGLARSLVSHVIFSDPVSLGSFSLEYSSAFLCLSQPSDFWRAMAGICHVSLNLGLSDVFSQFNSGHAFWVRIWYMTISSPVHHVMSPTMSKSHHWCQLGSPVKVGLPGFPRWGYLHVCNLYKPNTGLKMHWLPPSDSLAFQACHCPPLLENLLSSSPVGRGGWQLEQRGSGGGLGGTQLVISS